MNETERCAIKHFRVLINSNVDREEITYYLSEKFPDFSGYFEKVFIDHTVKISDIILFLKDIPGSFPTICHILSDDCSQDFIVDSLKQYIASHSIEVDTGEVDNTSASISSSSTTKGIGCHSVHYEIVQSVVDAISKQNTLEVVIYGPLGSGKTLLVTDVVANLEGQGYLCLTLDVKVKRFANLLAELETFVNREVPSNSLIVLDSCSMDALLRLRSGGESIYNVFQSKLIACVIVTQDPEVSAILPDCMHYKMPMCTIEQLDTILSQSFNFSSEKRSKIISILEHNLLPLHTILVGALFISVGESHIELIKALPIEEKSEIFISAILRKVIEKRRNVDEVYIIASILLFHDVGGATKENLLFLLNNYHITIDQVESCLEKLLVCRLVNFEDEKSYFICSDFSDALMVIDELKAIWKKLLVTFCLLYLKTAEHVILSFNENKNASKFWGHIKKFVIKAITYPIPSHDKSLQSILILRYRVVAKLRTVWQSRLLTIGESVDIYENIIASISNIDVESPDIVLLHRTILIHYMSLFFYFQKIEEYEDIISDIFSRINEVHQKHPIKDELYCELLSHIIESKIQEGKISDGIKNLKILIQEQQNLPDKVSKDNVALTKIRLAQLKILHGDSSKFDFDSENLGEALSATPQGRPQMINTKIRMSRGDNYYMNNDFVSSGWNYEIALCGLDDIRPPEADILMQNEKNKLQQQILSHLGNLGLQSTDSEELAKSLKHFQKCQALYKQVENGKSYHKYLVFTAVTYILMGENSNALYQLLDYIKYTPHKPVFIAVTNLDVQQMISKNLQERLEGHDLKHIDNHVYQGKVNFLHLTSTNYEWVKNQTNEEIIEIASNIPVKTVRANTLQFPNQQAQSNKCLVVVFMESHHQRTYSDRTNISELTDVSLSSFRSDIIDPDSDTLVDDDRNTTTTVRNISIIDSMLHNSLDFARDVFGRARTDFIKSLTSSIVDKIF